MRFLPRSLHGRMLALSVAATLVALALAGVAIGGILGRFVTEGLDRRLDGEVALLASAVDRDGHVDRERLGARVGAFERGGGWGWRVSGPDGVLRSADFPRLDDGPRPGDGPPPPHRPPGPDDGAHPRPLDGADEEGDAAHARQLVIPTRRGPVTLTAAAPRDVARRPIRGAVGPLLAALVGLAAFLTAAMLVQLRVGLRPLRRLRDEVAAIRAGQRERVDEDQPDELRPLAVELNALAADNAAALATARRSAANLAHALKTPVATLAIDLADQPRLAAQVARVDATIRHHLARARAELADRRDATPVLPAVDDVVAAIRRLHRDRAIAIEVAGGADCVVAVDPHDLEELLGNLLDNAARHAAARVTVTIGREGRSVAIAIEDDGPGIPADERARVFQPGTRLDERGEGYGFGLAISGDLAAIYGGGMTLGDSPLGGLAVRLTLPAR